MKRIYIQSINVIFSVIICLSRLNVCSGSNILLNKFLPKCNLYLIIFDFILQHSLRWPHKPAKRTAKHTCATIKMRPHLSMTHHELREHKNLLDPHGSPVQVHVTRDRHKKKFWNKWAFSGRKLYCLSIFLDD